MQTRILAALVLVGACTHVSSRPGVTMTTDGVVKPGDSSSVGGSAIDAARVHPAPRSPFENGPSGESLPRTGTRTGTYPADPVDFDDRDAGASTTMP